MTNLLRKMWRHQHKHKKLEEWALAENDDATGWWGDGTSEGTGEARYAGSVPVERAASAPATARAVASALHIAKENHRKLRRVRLSISANGVLATDAISNETLLDLSIYRISFCSADAAAARVFAVVEGGLDANEHSAHVFVCSRRRHARGYALALAHAFNDAFLAWQSRRQTMPTRSAPAVVHPWVSFAGESDSESDRESPSAAVITSVIVPAAMPGAEPLLCFD